ncbi:hypothetical protein B1J92_I03850g [Nakaseomyces glabratus]|nr:hypothetical protein B1J91_I03850g [Nakaseomyces glabratus]OXB49378.1 hypothetical protein B1J92_I03850g [Nakaseomyces glabratus]
MSNSKIKIKKNKKNGKSLKQLHKALSGLLQKDNKPQKKDVSIDKKHSKRENSCERGSKDDPDKEVKKKNGRAYIYSKENQLIPKLTDEEVMEKHKLADQRMKTVWSNIIDKYSNVVDEGDVIDLQSGEIITDNGHIRNLNTGFTSSRGKETRYTSVVKDILLDENVPAHDSYDEYSIWEDNDAEEEEAVFTDPEEPSTSESE